MALPALKQRVTALATARAGQGGMGALLAQQDKDIAARTALSDQRMANLWAREYRKVFESLDALTHQITAAQIEGREFSPDWLRRQARYNQMLDQIATAAKKYSAVSSAHISHLSRTAWQDALARVPSEAKTAAGISPTGLRDPVYDDQMWSRVNEATARYMDTMTHDLASPLRELLDKAIDGTFQVAAAKDMLTHAMTAGWGPLKTASELRKSLASMSLARARTIARTEYMRTYREAKREAWTRSPAVNGWIWHTNLDGATCAVCVAMSGSIHNANEMQEGHPNCRCTMVPMTKNWEDLSLGLYGVGSPARRFIRDNAPEGEAYFKDRMTAEQRKRLLGPTRYDSWSKGLPLKDMVGRTMSPAWGGMLRLKPLQQLAGEFPGLVKLRAGTPIRPAPPPPPKRFDFGSKLPKAAKTVMQNIGMRFLGSGKKGAWAQAGAFKDRIAKTQGEHLADVNDVIARWNGDLPGYRPQYAAGGVGDSMLGGDMFFSRFNLPKPWKQMTEAERRTFLSQDVGKYVREQLANEMVHTWAATSADDNPLSLLMQTRAEAVFSLNPALSHLSSKSGYAAAMNAPAELKEIADHFLRSMYKETQDAFLNEGITHISLARGQHSLPGYENMAHRTTQVGTVSMQPMSSWSSNRSTAQSFSGGAYTLVADFPVSWVVGSARTGFGCLNEQEFVLLNVAPFEATINRNW